MNSFNAYITGPWTEIWESLVGKDNLDRVKILEDLWILDYANKLNKEIDEIRVPNWAINYCKNQLQNSNHPLSSKIIEWMELNQLNAVWFQEKFLSGYLQLADDWLSINWVTILLEDEKKEDWNSYFTLDEMNKYVGNPEKRTIRNWAFILNILPWDDKNKSKFLRNVLWLNESEYWAVTGYTNMAGCLEIGEDYVRNTGSIWNIHALRCAKREGSNNWWARFC